MKTIPVHNTAPVRLTAGIYSAYFPCFPMLCR